MEARGTGVGKHHIEKIGFTLINLDMHYQMYKDDGNSHHNSNYFQWNCNEEHSETKWNIKKI